MVDHFGSSFHIRSTTTTSKLPSCSPAPDPCGLPKFDPAAVLSSGVEEVDGAVPEVTFFLNAVQYALRPPLIWTDLEFLRGRDGACLAVTGAGSVDKSVVGKRSGWSLAFIVVVWGDFGRGGVGGDSETERERRILKRMPGPSQSPLGGCRRDTRHWTCTWIGEIDEDDQRLYTEGVTYDSNWKAARAPKPCPLQSLFSSFPRLWCITTSSALLSSQCLLPRDTSCYFKNRDAHDGDDPALPAQRLTGGPEDSCMDRSLFSPVVATAH